MNRSDIEAEVKKSNRGTWNASVYIVNFRRRMHKNGIATKENAERWAESIIEQNVVRLKQRLPREPVVSRDFESPAALEPKMTMEQQTVPEDVFEPVPTEEVNEPVIPVGHPEEEWADHEEEEEEILEGIELDTEEVPSKAADVVEFICNQETAFKALKVEEQLKKPRKSVMAKIKEVLN